MNNYDEKYNLNDLMEDIKEKDFEIKELISLYKERKIPFRILELRINDFFFESKQDLKLLLD